MFQEKSEKEGKKYVRNDYDVALLRVEYPIADPDTGMTLLNPPRFNPDTIMPICLPPNKNFKDTNRLAYAAGLGITGEGGKDQRKRCFTNEKGPVAFQQCSSSFVLQNQTDFIDEDGTYAFAGHSYHSVCQMDRGPPSIFNPLCSQFYDKINRLR